MITIKNIAKIGVLINGRVLMPGELMELNSIEGNESRVLNKFFEIVSNENAPVNTVVEMEQPKVNEIKTKKVKK